jgi:hypothetical protein
MSTDDDDYTWDVCLIVNLLGRGSTAAISSTASTHVHPISIEERLTQMVWRTLSIAHQTCNVGLFVSFAVVHSNKIVTHSDIGDVYLFLDYTLMATQALDW